MRDKLLVEGLISNSDDLASYNVLVDVATGQVRLMGFGLVSRLPRERPSFIGRTDIGIVRAWRGGWFEGLTMGAVSCAVVMVLRCEPELSRHAYELRERYERLTPREREVWCVRSQRSFVQPARSLAM